MELSRGAFERATSVSPQVPQEREEGREVLE
jgi:hypothetical protein